MNVVKAANEIHKAMEADPLKQERDKDYVTRGNLSKYDQLTKRFHDDLRNMFLAPHPEVEL